MLQYNFFKYIWIVSNPGVEASFSDQTPSSTWTVKNLSTDVTTNNLLNILRTPNIDELSKNVKTNKKFVDIYNKYNYYFIFF